MNQTEDKKLEKQVITRILILLCIVVVFMSLGYGTGRLTAYVEDSNGFAGMVQQVTEGYQNVIGYVLIVVSLVTILASIFAYESCKKLYNLVQKDPENEDLLNWLDERLNAPIFVTNVMTIVEIFFFFAVMLTSIEEEEWGMSPAGAALMIGVFVVALVVMIAVQKLSIDLVKKMNPEKQGDVLDLNFQKVWMDSCDEAQQLIVYKAAYHAFHRMTKVYCILLMVSIVTGILFQTGIYPVFVICVIWLIHTISYMKKAAELEQQG